MSLLSGLFSWIRRNRDDIIVAVIGIIFATLIGLYIQGPDFNISIDEPLRSYSTPGDMYVRVTLESTNFLRGYDNRVGLMAIGRGKMEMPKGITAEFLGDEGSTISLYKESQTKVLKINTIGAKNTSHLIDILAFGKDGKEKRCSFYLYHQEKTSQKAGELQ